MINQLLFGGRSPVEYTITRSGLLPGHTASNNGTELFTTGITFDATADTGRYVVIYSLNNGIPVSTSVTGQVYGSDVAGNDRLYNRIYLNYGQSDQTEISYLGVNADTDDLFTITVPFTGNIVNITLDTNVEGNTSRVFNSTFGKITAIDEFSGFIIVDGVTFMF